MAEDLEMHGAYPRLRFVSQKVFRGAGGGGGGGAGGEDESKGNFVTLFPRPHSTYFIISVFESVANLG